MTPPPTFISVASSGGRGCQSLDLPGKGWNRGQGEAEEGAGGGLVGNVTPEEVKLLVDVLHWQLLLAQPVGLLGTDGAVAAAAVVPGDALAGWATAHAQLQVLLLSEGASHLLGHADGEGQLLPCPAHNNGGADVGCPDLHVLPGSPFEDAEAVPARPFPPVQRAIHKSRWEVVCLGLIDFLVNALLHVLEDDGDLERREEGWQLQQEAAHSPTTPESGGAAFG
uniref:Uncharacterized protein n=1 Tax=Pseudonaja textilis TaxID=8673 RepID=A0A670YYM0_PSETE